MEMATFRTFLACPGIKGEGFHNKELYDMCQEAVFNANINLMAKHRVYIYEMDAFPSALELRCRIPKEHLSEVSTKWFRGIGRYLIEKYPETFVKYKRGTGLFMHYLHTGLEDQND